MNKEEISEAVKDIKFVEKIMDIQSPEEIQKAFKAKGIDLSLEESQVVISTIKKVVENESCELSEEDLSEIAGGMKLGNAQKISLALAGALGGAMVALCMFNVK